MNTNESIAALYAEYNVNYFGGLLETPQFGFFHATRSLGEYVCRREDSHRSSIIKIAVNADWTRESIERVLVHQMIHQYIHEVLHREPLFPHGYLFRRECRRLRREHGLVITAHSDLIGR